MEVRTAVVAIVLSIGVSAAAQAQSLGDVAKKAAADKAAKAKSGETAPATKTITNKDLRHDPGESSTEPVVVGTDAKSQDALAALRAVQSVLDGGANASEFKRYYLEAKVKVDALSTAADAAPLRTISDLYADAVTLTIARQVRELSESDLKAFRARYSSDYELLGFFNGIPGPGVSIRWMIPEVVEYSLIKMKAAEQVLLIRAAEKLRAIKS